MKRGMLLAALCGLFAANLQAQSNIVSVSADAVTSPSRMQLRWSSGTNLHGFYIDRAPVGTTAFQQIAKVGKSVRSYLDSGLWAQTPYTYRVRSYKGGRTSPGAIVTGTTAPLGLPVVTISPASLVITMPSSVTMTGTVFVDGIRPTDTIRYQWVLIAGPDSVQMDNPTGLVTRVWFSRGGNYKVVLQAFLNSML